MCLEENHERKGEPFNSGRWCRDASIKENILEQNHNFDFVLQDDHY